MKDFSDKYVESIIRKAMSGTMSIRECSVRLGISRQYMYRLVERYSREGASFLPHGNRGKQRAWKTDEESEERIVSLYEGKYRGFNFRHFCEKLNEVEGVRISYEPLYRILTEAGIRSPKHHRKKGKESMHPTRPRRLFFGELLQTDASLHNWFGEQYPKATLHGAIDDATGTVMGLFFDKEETLRGYYSMLWQVLTMYGIPEAFYSDNRTIFEFRKLSEKDKSIDRDVNIQFRRCCGQLGIELITTSTAQAKGRIERLWETLQSRLISELSLKDIHDIDAANAFLPEFMEDYNRRFALPPGKDYSAFVEPPEEKEIDYYLSIEYRRKIDNGSAFSFFGTRLQLVTTCGKVVRIAKGTQIHVYRTFRGNIVAVHDGKFFETADALAVPAEPVEKTPRQSKPWVPAPNHPWRKFVVGKFK